MSGSLGPSVVEAIQTRNVTCLAKKPIVRDPHVFDRKEAARGSRAREVTCRIQKWNIKAEGFHPILVANARVDWLAMDDDFFWLVAAWVKSRAERPSVSGVNRQLHVQIGCKLIIRNRFFLARCCLGQVPGGAPFSQRSEQATACTNRMQIRN